MEYLSLAFGFDGLAVLQCITAAPLIGFPSGKEVVTDAKARYYFQFPTGSRNTLRAMRECFMMELICVDLTLWDGFISEDCHLTPRHRMLMMIMCV